MYTKELMIDTIALLQKYFSSKEKYRNYMTSAFWNQPLLSHCDFSGSANTMALDAWKVLTSNEYFQILEDGTSILSLSMLLLEIYKTTGLNRKKEIEALIRNLHSEMNIQIPDYFTRNFKNNTTTTKSSPSIYENSHEDPTLKRKNRNTKNMDNKDIHLEIAKIIRKHMGEISEAISRITPNARQVFILNALKYIDNENAFFNQIDFSGAGNIFAALLIRTCQNFGDLQIPGYNFRTYVDINESKLKTNALKQGPKGQKHIPAVLVILYELKIATPNDYNETIVDVVEEIEEFLNSTNSTN